MGNQIKTCPYCQTKNEVPPVTDETVWEYIKHNSPASVVSTVVATALQSSKEKAHNLAGLALGGVGLCAAAVQYYNHEQKKHLVTCRACGYNFTI